MALTVKRGGVVRPTVWPYLKKSGYWHGSSKVYIKKSGAWVEVFPLVPNPPTSVAIYPYQSGQIIVIDSYWGIPAAGASAFTYYALRIVFTHPGTGQVAATDWMYFNTSTYSYHSDNNGGGWQYFTGWNVKAEVAAVALGTALIGGRWSTIASSAPALTPGIPPPPVVVVPPLVAPVAPTSYSANVQNCALSQSWYHPGGNSLSYFEVQVWLGANAPTVYYLDANQRSFDQYPWDANTIGRNWVSSQVRAVGPGGASAWASYAAIMPGPLSIPYTIFQNGTMYSYIQYNYDGFQYWSDYWGNPAWAYQGVSGGWPADGSGSGYWVSDPPSSGYARDNSTMHRLVFLPRNYSNGWTGRYQGSPYAAKIPNPVFFQPNDCNTWWSNPIPGKWRTNPQAENWFYQGKSISGNSYGTLFYRSQVQDYFSASRIGYTPTLTSWDIYVKRTNTGGLASPVALNIGLHNRQDDSLAAAPFLIALNGGPTLARDQKAWVPLWTSWWGWMLDGTGKGISFYVDPNQADNQLRSEIGNVSNRYMILDKPTYGSTLDGQIPGTLRVYHNG